MTHLGLVGFAAIVAHVSTAGFAFDAWWRSQP